MIRSSNLLYTPCIIIKPNGSDSATEFEPKRTSEQVRTMLVVLVGLVVLVLVVLVGLVVLVLVVLVVLVVLMLVVLLLPPHCYSPAMIRSSNRVRRPTEQLRSAGVIEAIRISRAAYPNKV